MFNKIKAAISNFSQKGGIFMFLRAQLSSQIATVLDNSVAFILKKTLDIFKVKIIYFFSQGIESYVFATVIGQIIGGTFMCFINYRWTFRAKAIKFHYIFARFVMVWIGSVMLNTFLTFKLTELLRSTPFLLKLLGTNSDDIFIIVKLVVALIVGVVWNYTMYSIFVYRNIDFRFVLKNIFSKFKKK